MDSTGTELGDRPPNNWLSSSPTGSEFWLDRQFYLEFFEHIDKLAELFWNIESSKTAY